MASLAIIVIIILLVNITHLVDRIVGQMHEQVVKVLVGWFLVGLRAEPCDARLVDVDPKRVNSIKHNVYPQIVF